MLTKESGFKFVTAHFVDFFVRLFQSKVCSLSFLYFLMDVLAKIQSIFCSKVLFFKFAKFFCGCMFSDSCCEQGPTRYALLLRL